MLKKKIYFLILLFIALAINPAKSSVDNCYSKISNFEAQDIFNSTPSQITIEVNNSRSWYTNILEVLVERENKVNQYANNSSVPKKNKKRFRSIVKAKYKNGLECKFNSRIRLSGDLKDHIQIVDGNFFTSVDVKLDDGNINGIVDFKLLIPETRKNPNYEILFTQMMSELDILAPRTFLTDVKINNLNKRMLFQEKIRKEMLEFNNRVEGPLLEGSERYMFNFFKDNNPFFNAGISNQISRITNSNWASKSKNHLYISNLALTKLNKIYLKWIYEIKYGNVNLSHYNLNNDILSNSDEKVSEKFGIFNSLMFGAGARHGMSPHNRKFYWNSIRKYFEPIYYDGDIEIYKAKDQIKIFEDELVEYTIMSIKDIETTLSEIQKIDKNRLYKKFKSAKGTLSKKDYENFYKELTNNLLSIKKKIINKKIPSNNIKKEILKNYYNNLEKTKTTNDDIKAVFTDLNGKYLSCEIKKNNCAEIFFNKEEVFKLISDELEKDGTTYQYIGIYEAFEGKIKSTNYNSIKIQNSNFFFDENTSIDYKEEDNILNIYQINPDARAYFMDGDIKNLNIKFVGLEPIKNDDNFKNPIINENGLTGCLSFINMSINLISIQASKGSCEDSINLINTNGSMKSVQVKDAYSDGIDFDFSDINLINLKIKSSNNDCADFSYGNYSIEKVDLNNCGDKAISVGEKSNLKINEITVLNSDTGVASKDGSIVNIKKNNFKNLNTCLSAYNKKQEFFGGYIKVENFLCQNFTKKIEVDNFSQIVQSTSSLE